MNVMKTKQITVALCGPDNYKVESLVNRITPTVGSYLSPAKVEQYINDRDTKVVVKVQKY